MTARPGRLAAPDPLLLDKLVAAVRPEFATALIRIDADHPVFARGRCQVVGCGRGAWTRMLCNGHYGRWRSSGRPDVAAFAVTAGPLKSWSDRVDAFDLRGLSQQVRLEIAYSIQCRHDERAVRLIPTMINRLVVLVVAARAASLLDHTLPRWTMLAHQHGLSDTGGRAMGQLRYAWRHLRDLADDTDAETEFAGDVWRSMVLGVRPSPKLTEIRFDHIEQPWLRQAVKRACRYRLGAGKAFASVSIDERALRWFATFLTQQHPDVTGPGGITREVLEHYLSWITAAPELSGNTTNTYLVVLRGFLDACHRHGWMPGLPGRAALYLDELPSPSAAAAAVHPGVRDGPARRPRPPGQAARPDHSTPGGGDPRDRAARQRRLRVAVQPGHRRQRRLAVSEVPQHQDGQPSSSSRSPSVPPTRSAPNKTISAVAGPAAARGCSRRRTPTPTGPAPSPTPPCGNGSATGKTTSACMTKQVSACPSPPTSSVTPWALG